MAVPAAQNDQVMDEQPLEEQHEDTDDGGASQICALQSRLQQVCMSAVVGKHCVLVIQHLPVWLPVNGHTL
jgi:hypothetical protein